ncbi:MAG: sigma-70 family RNA polymerase sigma factor [Bacteroidales bacterium]|nr:sigma-70 family RNA polymerase sigma factor [Bacteroidales bacterium]
MNEKHLEEIINGCKKGKRRSQEMLYREYSGKMYAVCLYYAGNKSEAEDFLHNGFIKVFKYIKQYRKEGAFVSWMRKIFMHTALEKYKQKQLLIQSEDENSKAHQATIEEDILSRIAAEDLIRIIQQLSPAYRMVFNLFAVEGYSHKEISEILGISEGTSKSNLSRARNILQAQVKTHFELSRSRL